LLRTRPCVVTRTAKQSRSILNFRNKGFGYSFVHPSVPVTAGNPQAIMSSDHCLNPCALDCCSIFYLLSLFVCLFESTELMGFLFQVHIWCTVN